MPSSFGSLNGQVALITGGAGGLGREAALWLAVAGAQVVVADVNAAALERAEITLTEKLPDAKSFHYAALDVTDSAAVRDLVADIGSRHGRLDILLTSHGFPRDRRLEDMADDDWNEVIGVCLTGTFLCIRESARLMAPQAYGRIITVASRAWHGNPGQANYSAAKAGVVGLTKSVARELGRHGVTANAVAPGLTDTQSLRELETFDQIAERAIRDNSVKRIGQPSDVAAAVLFLASPEAGFVTGEVIHVSGGRFG
jgi:3-oxoacyl-[acyl-carrier protein] reductase